MAAPKRTDVSQVQPNSVEAVEPPKAASRSDTELRRQILADKGVTLADLADLPGPMRLLLEARIQAEIARRATAHVLDLRV